MNELLSLVFLFEALVFISWLGSIVAGVILSKSYKEFSDGFKHLSIMFVAIAFFPIPLSYLFIKKAIFLYKDRK
jgi:hypothetical protein